MPLKIHTFAWPTSASSSHSNSQPEGPRFTRSGSWLETITSLQGNAGRVQLRLTVVLAGVALKLASSAFFVRIGLLVTLQADYAWFAMGPLRH